MRTMAKGASRRSHARAPATPRPMFPWEDDPFEEGACIAAAGIPWKELTRAGAVGADHGRSPRLGKGSAQARERAGVFLRELVMLLRGEWPRLEESLAAHPLPGASEGLAIERALLLFLCHCRGGSRDAISPVEDDLLRRVDDARAPWVGGAIEVESLIARGRLGHYLAALPRLVPLADIQGARSCYWAQRIALLVSTGEQALGRYDESAGWIRRAEAVVRLHPCAPFEVALARRRVSLALEREDFETARSRMPKAEARARAEGLHVELAFLLQERVRLCVTEGNAAGADGAMAELESCVRRANLSVAFMSLVEERCELALRSEDHASALALLDAFVSRARARGEAAGEAVGSMYQARALHASGRSEEARSRLTRALTIARAERYGKARVRMLFYASALERDAGRPVRSRFLLDEAGALASTMGLPVQRLCHAFAVENLDAGRARLGPLLEALGSVASFEELFHYLKFYGYFSNRRVHVSHDGGSWEGLPLLSFLEDLRHSATVCFVENEALVASSAVGGGATTRRLDDKVPVDRLALYLLRRCGSGAPPDRLHALSYPNVAFEPERHGGRLRMLVSRVRNRLAPLGGSVAHERPPGRYVVRFESSFVRVRLERSDGAARPTGAGAFPRPAEREEEILRLLGERGASRTTDLCSALGLRRQSLHPWLKKLEAAGLVRHRGHGRARTYVPVPR